MENTIFENAFKIVFDCEAKKLNDTHFKHNTIEFIVIAAKLSNDTLNAKKSSYMNRKKEFVFAFVDSKIKKCLLVTSNSLHFKEHQKTIKRKIKNIKNAAYLL